MVKEVKLARKIKRFLKRLGYPRWLHQFGPKTYQLFDHVFALIAVAIFRLSLRRVEKLMKELFGIKTPTYSALCKSRKRIPPLLWQRVMALTAGATHACVAIDSTGFSRANPSLHYIKRVNRVHLSPAGYVKQSSLVDVRRRTFVALRVRSKPRHDLMDAKYLLKGQKCKTLLADRAYDAEVLHEHCWKRNIRAMIKPKLWNKKGWYRRKQRRIFDESLYHQRSIIEAAQGAVKRKYGGYTLAKGIQAIKAEAYCKAIAYNMRLGE
jgi:Transposase DDE domain